LVNGSKALLIFSIILGIIGGLGICAFIYNTVKEKLNPVISSSPKTLLRITDVSKDKKDPSGQSALAYGHPVETASSQQYTPAPNVTSYQNEGQIYDNLSNYGGYQINRMPVAYPADYTLRSPSYGDERQYIHGPGYVNSQAIHPTSPENTRYGPESAIYQGHSPYSSAHSSYSNEGYMQQRKQDHSSYSNSPNNQYVYSRQAGYTSAHPVISNSAVSGNGSVVGRTTRRSDGDSRK
jgi:hypothetical protein